MGHGGSAAAFHLLPNIQGLINENATVLKNLEEILPKNPMFPAGEVKEIINKRFQAIMERLQRPKYERTVLPPLTGSLAAVQFVEALNFEESLEQSETVFVRDQAKMQQLGVHAAIRLYRWNHVSCLPTTKLLLL